MNKTNTFKKALSVVLTLLMVLSTLVIMPMSASATTLAPTDAIREQMARVWDGKTTAAADYQGSGTEADPLRIYTGADLQGLKAAATATGQSTVYVKLMND